MSKLVCIDLSHMFTHFCSASLKLSKKCPSLTKLLPKYITSSQFVTWYYGIEVSLVTRFHPSDQNEEDGQGKGDHHWVNEPASLGWKKGNHKHLSKLNWEMGKMPENKNRSHFSEGSSTCSRPPSLLLLFDQTCITTTIRNALKTRFFPHWQHCC